MWTKTTDGSIVDNGGRVIYFSAKRFVSDICLGNCCFICGVPPNEAAFNNEHVLPEWLLRRFSLFSSEVTLPNETTFGYDRYKMRCCVECNTLMGELIENPVSEVISGGAKAIYKFIEKEGGLKFLVWMGLIFLKIHLKDRDFRLHLDSRKGEGAISGFHSWDELHHLHCIVRCFYNDCQIEEEAIGSFLCMAVRREASPDKFDFADLSQAQTMLLRLDDVGLLAVFNDSGGAMTFFSQRLIRITGAVSELQLREIMVDLAFLNQHLKLRPEFYSEFDMENERYRVLAKRPKQAELVELDYTIRGELLHHAFGYALPKLRVAGRTKEEILEAIGSGTFTFLFDDEGEFIEKSLVTTGHGGVE